MSTKLNPTLLAASAALMGGLGLTVAAAPKPPTTSARKTVTYCRDIAPLVQKNCESCHRAGEVAPFALSTYDDVKKRARQIAAVTQSRFMPPFKADAECAGQFQDARHLTDAQIALLQRWSDAGAPFGDKRDLPRPVSYPKGWALGTPDMILQPTRPYHLTAEGADIYRCFVVPTNFTEDKWVSAVDVKPGNAKVVHHVIAYIDSTGASEALDNKEAEPGYTSYGGPGFPATGTLGGWAPGITAHHLPAGTATFVPKGARVVLQVHYHKNGKPETDRTQVGVYFARTPTDKQVRILPLAAKLHITPGDPNYTTTISIPSPLDVHLVAITPHMHLLGRTMKVTAALPDGTNRTLVSISDWDFNWQATYNYKQPVALPRGTVLTMTATYDNSAQNPRNPNNPPKLVTWGEETTDEMCLAFLHFTVDAEHRAPAPTASR